MTRFARPAGSPTHSVRGQPHLLRAWSVQLAAPVVEPQSGLLIPPDAVPQAKKKPAFACELFFK